MERYTIQCLVGEGSFGRVYKALDLEKQTTVALKIIGKRGRTKKEIKNLRRECEIQCHLQHPNIIRMLDSFERTNEIVVVTEFAHSDLYKLLTEKRSIDQPRARKLTFDLVSALYYLHSHRILHRDLKPQNILLDHMFENAKLCDFGLARNMTMGTHVLTSIKGTPLYMAPELMSEKPYDYQADLWSLGCIIYETLAGEPPFCTTSFIQLVRIIRYEHVKWPSFLTESCRTFLKGLLEKDPAERFTWPELLNHSFVKDKILILTEDITDSPFTHPLTTSQNYEKEKQKNTIIMRTTTNLNMCHQEYIDNPISNSGENRGATSSRESLNVIVPSDVENIETDVDDVQSVYVDKSSYSLAMDPMVANEAYLSKYQHPTDFCFVTGNSNLIINHLHDNFPCLPSITPSQAVSMQIVPGMTSLSLEQSKVKDVSKSRNKTKELEKRKLSQNLDNFSVRLGKSIPDSKEIIDEEQGQNKSLAISEQNGTIKDKTPPSMLPGWDSCDEYHHPPIENEEWLAFLHRSMHEVLDGELDSLKQQNLVSIIVAPLRNNKASNKVIECVVQLLCLPLVINASLKDVLDIRNVYIEVKLVPNLVYASKLLCLTRSKEQVTSPSPTLEQTNAQQSYKNLNLLTSDEISTLLYLYELVCHLVHLNEQFLTQFCDAVAILGTSELLVNFISKVSHKDAKLIRMANTVLALLCFLLRELPENAELVDKIIFHKDIRIVALLKHPDNLLKSRMCMLLRMIGRFSCCALQNIWSVDIKSALETILNDANEQSQNEAREVVEEFQHLPFYTQ